MLAQDNYQSVTPSQSFAVLSQSIEESFASIDRFEFQVAEELRVMRDDRVFEEGGYKSFEEYCDRCLSRWGGYRRVNQLIGAQLVVNTLKGTEFDGVIKRESHARPLLRLVKTPEKLKEAVAIACQNSPTPVANNFKEAAALVEPPRTKCSNTQEQLFLKGAKVRVTDTSHPRHGQEGVINADAPNAWQQIVEFGDGTRELIHDRGLDASSVPYAPKPRTYTEEELQQAIARAIKEASIGDRSLLREELEKEVREEVRAAQAIASQKSLETAKLQQKIDELESLRTLELENKLLRQEVESLKSAIRDATIQRWDSVFTQEAKQVINVNVQKAVEDLDPELHLRILASSPPSRERYNEIIELFDKAADLLEIVPRTGRRVIHTGHLGTLEDVEDGIALIDWDDKRNGLNDRLVLSELEILPTVEGIARGSIVAWADTNHPAYHYKGDVLQVHARSKEVTVYWQGNNKTKTYPVSALRLIKGIQRKGEK